MASAQLAAQSSEALTNAAPPNRNLAAITAEAITTSAGSPSRQLAAISTETITGAASPPMRQLASMSVEVLVPVRLTFIGWGAPVISLTWS